MVGVRVGWTWRFVGCVALLLPIACFNDASPSTTNRDTEQETDSGTTSGTEGTATQPPGTTDDPQTTTELSSGGPDCAPLTADCDGNPDNGCETEVSADPDNCGGCDVSCETPMFCGAGECLAGCEENILYVSNDGDDTFHGCTPEFAMRSVQGAIDRARDVELEGYEVHACEGVYAEAVQLAYPVSLRGAYSCNTWMRTPDFAYDGEAETTIAGEGSTASLTILGPAVDGDVIVDGWTIVGPSQDAFSAAILVTESARPDINTLFALGGVGFREGSAGVLVAASAAPFLHGNVIDGGGRTDGRPAASPTSVGVWLSDDAGPTALHGNIINGGSASGASGSVGVLVRSDAPHVQDAAILGNNIDGGSGSCSGGEPCNAAVGVFLESHHSLELLSNQISAGEGRCENAGPAAACIQTAVLSATTAPTLIHANRIFGGEPQDPYFFVRGLSYQPVAGGVISNNFVHAGRPLLPSERDYVGIAIADSLQTARLVHNTIVTSAVTKNASTSVGVQVGSAPTELVANLFVGSDSSDMAIRANACDSFGGQVAQLTDNAFVNHGQNLVEVWRPPGCQSAETGNTIGDAVEALNAFNSSEGVTEVGNIRFGVCADAEPGCIGRPNCPSGDCPDTLFEGWGSNGIGPLGAGGWRLADGPPCALVEGATFDRDFPIDGYGTDRTRATSIGAEEYNGVCQVE